MTSSSVHPHFMDFLNGLGWTVSVHQHPGWTGHVSTAFLVTPQPQEGMVFLTVSCTYSVGNAEIVSIMSVSHIVVLHNRDC